jgi:hypothetical protein
MRKTFGDQIETLTGKVRGLHRPLDESSPQKPQETRGRMG